MSEEVRLDVVGEVRCLLLRLAQELMLLGGGSDGPRVVESGATPTPAHSPGRHAQ